MRSSHSRWPREPSLEGLWVAFILGVGSAASPCLLPLYPGFLAFLTTRTGTLEGRRASGLLGLVILAGVLTTMLAVAALLVAAAVSIASVVGVLVPFVDGLLIVLGLLLIAGRNPFERLPGARVPIVANPYGQAFLYGMMLGPLALPCAGAFALSVIAYSIGVSETLSRIATFVAFGLGFGLPLVLLSFLAGTRQTAVVGFVTRNRRHIEIMGGVLLVVVGLWDLAINWESIVLRIGR